MKRVTLDFETRSMCDLKKSGAYKYSLDPTTQPTCLAFKVRGSRTVNLLNFKSINLKWNDIPSMWRGQWRSYINQGYLFTGQNIFFDMCIYKNILVKRYGWPDIPFRQFRCTAAKAAACALPRSLEGAGRALELTTQKDYRGYAAVMATCKPTKQYNAWNKKFDKERGKGLKLPVDLNPPPIFLEPNAAPDVWNTLYEYCKIDVLTEELLDKTLPDLNPFEQEVWFLNQQLNWRGLRVDLPTIKKIVGIMEIESKTKLKDLDTLTMGLVTKAGARESILKFLKLEGIELPDIRAKTIEDALKDKSINGDVRKLLEIRKALSKTSTKKYQSFIDRAGEDNRVRDILLYHGASTGRDTGTGIQPHNFPRGAIQVHKASPYAAIENIIECDTELLKLFYGDNLSILFSSVLRNVIMPSKGCELFVADFSKIEVAVLWWLAENERGLAVLNSGKDPYKYQAAFNTGKKYEDIADDSNDRQLAKAQVLGCGFGMGVDKFQQTAWDMYRLKLTKEQSVQAVKNYRTANSDVPSLWSEYEQAAKDAITTKQCVEIGKCKFFVQHKFLWIELPSGRRLAYRKPTIGWRETPFGPRETIEFLGLGLDKKTLRYERTWGGTITENIVQAVARDIMVNASLNLEKSNYKMLLSVHDEVLTERRVGEGDVIEFKNIMCARPNWADEKLPIDAKAWKGPRYKK